MKKIPKRKFLLTTDSEGYLPLPKEIKAEIGDDFAIWKEGKQIILVFLKNYRGKKAIPKDAVRGKVEAALPEGTSSLTSKKLRKPKPKKA